jgi:hypothetical protein
MQIKKKLFTVGLFLAALPGLHAQVLDDFSTARVNGSGDPLWAAYQGEDPNQVFSIANGMMNDTGSPSTGCSYTGCGLLVQFMPWSNGYGYPNGYAQHYLKNGTWDPNNNRLNFRFKCDKSVAGQSGGSGNIQFGTYTRYHSASDTSWQGDHYYHFLDPTVHPGQWIYVSLNRVPQWQVGYSNTAYNFPEDPDYTGSNPVHYFDGLTRFYFDTQNGSSWSGVSCSFDDFTFAKVQGEPDSYVSSVTGQYSGTRYEVTWAAPRMVSGGQAYAIRYSTTGSMHANGFNSGTDGGTVRGPDSSTYVSTFWNSPAMQQAQTMWVAIQPVGQTAFTEVQIPASGTVTPPPPTSTSPCDFNKDGVVNNTDIQTVTQAALGSAACTSAMDLDGNGSCNAVDVQRTINASLPNGSCRVGQ